LLERNALLTSLTGLEDLKSIGQDLTIRYNPALSTSLAEAFAAREDLEIGGAVTIEGNLP